MSLARFGFTPSRPKRKNEENHHPVPQPTKKAKTGKQSTHFRNEWLNGRKSWLFYKPSEIGMYCFLCQKHNMRPYDRDTWNITPCKRLRLGSIKEHETSSAHQTAMNLELVVETTHNIAEVIQPEVNNSAITSAFKCLYFLAKRRIPHITNFEPLLDLLTQLGLNIKEDLNVAKNVTYCSNKSIQEMLSFISNQLEEATLLAVKNSPYFAIMLDETTDVSVSEQLTLNCRYIDGNGNLCVKFLKMIEPLRAAIDGDGTVALNAGTITNHVTGYFNDKGLSFEHLCGIGTDGAAVMTGRHNGVVKRLQEIAKSAIGIHCCGHRLQLATSQAANAVPFVKKFSSILRQLYDFFNNSAVRTAGLHAIQTALNEKVLKPIEPSSTRWLSIEHSVSRLKDSFISTLVSLEREGEERGDAKAIGLFHLARTYRFVATMLLLCDILPHVSRLCKAFQAREFQHCLIQPLVKATLTTISDMKTTDGPTLQELPQLLDNLKSSDIDVKERTDDADYFDKHIRGKYIDTLMENITQRFPVDDVTKLSQFSLFDPDLLRTADKNFGNDYIATLSEHFLDNTRTADVQNEWNNFMNFAKGSILKQQDSTTDVIVNYLCTNRLARDAFPNVTKLAQIYRILPCHTADSERTFSQLKLIKTVPRNRLCQTSLDGLIRIAIDGPPASNFDFVEVVKSWAATTNRRIRMQ
ncbi:zinc finger protein 862-like [Antedon mediterranea]|uniref:zinc finger protein 862-like n=1 Tax=Antedon mediterranea TaxID=105859 RepID=UPI003AF9E8FE